MADVALVVSLDTKAEEARYLREEIAAHGVGVKVVDFGIAAPGFRPDVTAAEIASLGGGRLEKLTADRDRAVAIDTMMRGVAVWTADAHARGALAGVISVGGSGGTAVGTAAMRVLPFGVPKVMVSTVAASDVSSYVGTKDITMINSVVDFAGLNSISEPMLRNAAAAVAAMAKAAAMPSRLPAQRLIAASQFGVTTPAVEQARALLERAGYTLVPFHATGIGGRTMEALIADGLFEAVLDLTTTEWADEIAGGNLSAGPDRLGAAARAGLPQVIAPGALDMANFFGVPVPERHAGRLIHQHNANVALMRTTAEENAEIGRRIAGQLNQSAGPVVVLFPLRGISALDAAGQPFFDPATDAALLEALRAHLAPTVRLVTLDLHLNDASFAERAVAELLALIEHKKRRHA